MTWEIIKWILLAVVFIFALTALTGAPYVPSKVSELKKAFKNLYPLSKKDLLVDLGSGDGVVLKVANDFGAKGFGVELNPFLVIFTKLRFLRNKDIKVKMGNLFAMDFPEKTTVVYIFGDDRDITKMIDVVQKQANKLGHDLFVISHGFEIPHKKPVKRYRAYLLYKITCARDA